VCDAARVLGCLRQFGGILEPEMWQPGRGDSDTVKARMSARSLLRGDGAVDWGRSAVVAIRRQLEQAAPGRKNFSL